MNEKSYKAKSRASCPPLGSSPAKVAATFRMCSCFGLRAPDVGSGKTEPFRRSSSCSAKRQNDDACACRPNIWSFFEPPFGQPEIRENVPFAQVIQVYVLANECVRHLGVGDSIRLEPCVQVVQGREQSPVDLRGRGDLVAPRFPDTAVVDAIRVERLKKRQSGFHVVGRP